MSNQTAVKVRTQVVKQSSALSNPWKWKARREGWLLPSKMETRHLFYTLRMIWNNRMPAHMHVGYRVIYYTFSSDYTDAYLKQAIIHLYTELETRTDLSRDFQRELNQMKAWFDKERPKLEQECLKLEDACEKV